MTGDVGSVQDGPGGEPNINVKSLRMRFEKSDSVQEGVMTDKGRSVDIASKASESIKKFESLAKQEPGFKPSDALVRSLSKSMSTKGSVRVGSLRHKFESLANLSLTADLFNAPGESDDLTPSSKQVSQETPESDSIQGSSNNVQVSAKEGEPEVQNSTIAVEAVETVADVSAEGEAVAEEMSTFTFETEDSIEEPALCLKEQIERAQADEIHSTSTDCSVKQTFTGHDDPIKTHVAENFITELNDTAGRTVADNELTLQQREPIDNSDGLPVGSSDASADNLPTAFSTVSGSIIQASAIAVSEGDCNAENAPQVQDNMKTEVNNRLVCPAELDTGHEQVPIEIERSQLHRRKSRGFFHRLFTCGISV